MIVIKTYQDLLLIPDAAESKMRFVENVINGHKATEMYATAKIANEYFKKRNVTIKNYQKLLYTVSGKAIPDNWSANYKIVSSHFYRFIVQESQYLLGNGVMWSDKKTADKLGTKEIAFDNQLQDLAVKALTGGVAFGFYNLDHVDVFSVLEFAPLFDELSGSIKAGVRFWRISEDKPLRATLYELDGYTDFLWLTKQNATPTNEWNRISSTLYYKDKKSYKLKINKTKADGEQIVDGENYLDFPIVPLWGNKEHQSEIVGLREQIDGYDLIKSGFCNDVDEASYIYWTLTNAGGMDDIDLAEFKRRMKTLKVAKIDDDVQAESHTIDVSYQSRESLLNRLDKDLYRDAMALNVEEIAGGAVTATQIEAAYEPLNSKVDRFEYCVNDFINKILYLANIDDKFSFTRSKIINVNEDVQTVSQAAAYLPEDYVTTKILTILGDGDKAEDIINQMHADDLPTIDNE